MLLDAIDGFAPMRGSLRIGGRIRRPTGVSTVGSPPRFNLKPARRGVQYAWLRIRPVREPAGTEVRASGLLIRGWRSMDLSIQARASHTTSAQLEFSAIDKKYLTNPAEHALGSHRSCMGQRATNPSNGATDA